MVALSIFIVVMTISMGSIISVFDANRKSRSLKAVLSNLNLAVESMSREIRFGTNYHCDYLDLAVPITDPQDCTYPSVGNESISFLSSDGTQITYKLNHLVGPPLTREIEKRVGAFGNAWIAVTAPEILINDLTFYVLGAENPSDTLQPKVVIIIKGFAGAEGKGKSDFILQTTVSQRVLDI